MVLSIIDTIYIVIGGAVLVALYYLIKSDERWFQVRMGGLIFVCLMVLAPLLLLRCNVDIFGAENELREVEDLLFGSNILQHEAEEPAMEMKNYVKKKLDDGKFKSSFTLISLASKIYPDFPKMCITENDAEILRFSINYGSFYQSGGRYIATASWGILYDTGEPQSIEVVIITDKDPGNLRCYYSIDLNTRGLSTRSLGGPTHKFVE